jgi:hypothetical protein
MTELPGLPRHVLEAVQHEVERVSGTIVGPFDAVFDMLQETATTMRRQAEALESAGRALEEAAGLMKAQADLFDRTVGTVRQPLELAKHVTGSSRAPAPRSRGPRARE